MKTLPRVRFLIAWGAYCKGDVIQPPSAMRRNELLNTVWYGRRIAELVVEPEATPPPALPPESEADTPPTAVEPETFTPDPTPPQARWGQGKHKRGQKP